MSTHKDHSRISENWEFLCESKDGTLLYAEQGFVKQMYGYSWPRDDLIGLLGKIGSSECPSLLEAWRELMKQFDKKPVFPQVVDGGGPEHRGVMVLGLRPRSDGG